MNEERGWGEVVRGDDGRITQVGFVVPGPPKTWLRARRGKDGPMFTPADRESKMAEVRDAWRSLEIPHFAEGVWLALGVQVWIERPGGHYGTGRNAGILKDSSPVYPGSGKFGGDVANFVKLVEDALNKVAYHDDAQIQRYLMCAKWYVLPGELPRTQVTIEPLAPVDHAQVDGQERLIAA